MIQKNQYSQGGFGFQIYLLAQYLKIIGIQEFWGERTGLARKERIRNEMKEFIWFILICINFHLIV